MDVSLRKATLKDLQEIQSLNLLLFRKEYREYDNLLDLSWTFGQKGTRFFKSRIAKGFVVVAELDGKSIGYLCGGIVKAEPYRKLPKTAEIENMFVLDRYRSKGVGTGLYKRFLSWCKEKKVRKVRVQASAQNVSAIGFYQKNGFQDYTLILEHDLQ